MKDKVTYFVIYKPQQGEINPAYSFMDKTTMDQAMKQGIIDTSYIVPTKDIHSKEEVLALLDRYKKES